MDLLPYEGSHFWTKDGMRDGYDVLYVRKGLQ